MCIQVAYNHEVVARVVMHDWTPMLIDSIVVIVWCCFLVCRPGWLLHVTSRPEINCFTNMHQYMILICYLCKLCCSSTYWPSVHDCNCWRGVSVAPHAGSSCSVFYWYRWTWSQGELLLLLCILSINIHTEIYNDFTHCSFLWHYNHMKNTFLELPIVSENLINNQI